MRQIIKHLTALAIMVLAFVQTMPARDYGVNDVPNSSKEQGWQFVSDPEGLLGASAREAINTECKALYDSTTVELAVVVLPSIGGESIDSFAPQLFKRLGVGKSDKNNGVLLLLVTEDRKVRIETGYGVEGALPDMVAAEIIRRDIVPHMKEGNTDAAMLAASRSISSVLRDPSVRDELMSSQKGGADEPDTLDIAVLMKFLWTVVSIMIICGLVLFVADLFNTKGKSNYNKVAIWESHKISYLVLGILSMGIGLVFYAICVLMIRRYRNRPLRCDTCGSKMEKLSEEKDNELLNGAQDLEERLNTVDYDVWVCPTCGTVERLPYKIRQSKYTECPKCHTVANRLVMNKVVYPATTRQAGEGVKVYECAYCGNRSEKRYKIPRKNDDGTGGLVAGAAIGSMLGRGGGGGFSGGGFGGFGGGMSGGGGASGGW